MFAKCSLHLLISLSTLHLAWCQCYFPGEIQGVWETQGGGGVGGPGAPIRYQEVRIEPDAILEWGSCHARLDQNIILADRSGSGECYRCVRLEVVSAQVVQVWSMTSLHTCYTTEQVALRNCPSLQDVRQRRAIHIMLYKSESVWGERNIPAMECPFSGRYTFTYQRRAGAGAGAVSCPHPVSEFSNCPHGFGYNVIYRDCNPATPQRGGLQCLGSWTGHDGRNYLVVWDSSHARTSDHARSDARTPKYKCGVFREETGTGRVLLSFSEDSTCHHGLSSPSDGHETYLLTSVLGAPLPPEVSAARCGFPPALLGHWHHTLLVQDTMLFKDYVNYKTYSARCVKDVGDGEKFLVYSRSHCGEWAYNCLWLKRRAANILEFMMGLYPLERLDETLCDDANFGDQTTWTTQAKSLLESAPTCPVVGRYAGELPDASGICASLHSDCAAPQLMYYQVAECRNQSAVYEEREYQCLGQWEEEGRIYALTYRRDVRTYECFVGVLREEGDVVFIKEAGAVCSRGVQPEVLGMKLHRINPCSAETTSRATQSSQHSTIQRHLSTAVTRPPYHRTTRPWKPITGRPSQRGSGSERTTRPSYLLLLLLLILIPAVVLKL